MGLLERGKTIPRLDTLLIVSGHLGLPLSELLRHEKLRRRYPEVHGKKVDWISHWYEEGLCFFSVRFTDGKNFCVACHPEIVTDIVDFSDMKTGDEVSIREYYKRRDED